MNDFLRTLASYLGVVRPVTERRTDGGPQRSRYGLQVGARLDQDLDDLRRRVEQLERRVADGD